MHTTLKGRIVLITGGSGTLGRALVRQALNDEATVMATVHHHAVLDEGARALSLDLATDDSIRQCASDLMRLVPRIDVLINNAAAVDDHTMVSMSDESFDHIMAVDCSGVLKLIGALLPLLEKSDRGKIINVVSAVGLHGAFGQANYAAAKGALIAATCALARELGPKRICVNAVNPGFMPSAMTEHIPEEVKERKRAESCLGTMADPAEAARFILYLASDAVTNVTGQVFHIDSRIVV